MKSNKCKVSLLITMISLTLTSFTVFSQPNKAVKIGEQEWMSTNLNVTTFRNLDPIPQAKTAKEWQTAKDQKKPAWCYYNNDPAMGKKYGKLYNWFAVNDKRGLAPKGWYLPSQKDWDALIGTLRGQDVAGNKIKTTTGWGNKDMIGNGTNESHFTALPGGIRYMDEFSNPFKSEGIKGSWWSTNEVPIVNYSAFYFTVSCVGSANCASSIDKGLGMSVRCIKTGKEEPAGKYKTVKIGTQIWMTENLNVSTFRNGDPIPEESSEEKWKGVYEEERLGKNPDEDTYWNRVLQGPLYYENKLYKSKLYNWFAVNDPRGLAPKGWHIPSRVEWETLMNFLGGEEQAVKKLKSKIDWDKSYFGNGTNEVGFNGLPFESRYHEAYGTNYKEGGYGNGVDYWSSSESNAYAYGSAQCYRCKTRGSAAYKRSLFVYKDTFHADWDFVKTNLLSVRCIKD